MLRTLTFLLAASIMLFLFLCQSQPQAEAPNQEEFIKRELAENGLQDQDKELNLLTPFRKGEGWYFVNRDQEVELRIEGSYDIVYPFEAGLAMVFAGDRYGFIDASGKEVIAPQFLVPHKVSYFLDNPNLLRIRKPEPRNEGNRNLAIAEKFTIFDRQRKMHLPEQYHFRLTKISRSHSTWVGEDATGEFVPLFHDNLCGLVDRDLINILPFSYDSIQVGKAASRFYGSSRSRTGNAHAQDIYRPKQYFIAYLKDETWGFLSPKELAESKFDEVRSGISHKIMHVRKGSKWGVVDDTGRFVVPVAYDERFQERIGAPGSAFYSIILRNTQDTIEVLYKKDYMAYEQTKSIREHDLIWAPQGPIASGSEPQAPSLDNRTNRAPVAPAPTTSVTEKAPKKQPDNSGTKPSLGGRTNPNVQGPRGPRGHEGPQGPSVKRPTGKPLENQGLTGPGGPIRPGVQGPPGPQSYHGIRANSDSSGQENMSEEEDRIHYPERPRQEEKSGTVDTDSFSSGVTRPVLDSKNSRVLRLHTTEHPSKEKLQKAKGHALIVSQFRPRGSSQSYTGATGSQGPAPILYYAHSPFSKQNGNKDNQLISARRIRLDASITDMERGIASHYLIKKNNLLGIGTYNGKMILPYNYDEILISYETGRATYSCRKGESWMEFDQNGELINEAGSRPNHDNVAIEGIYHIIQMNGQFKVYSQHFSMLFPHEFEKVASWHYKVIGTVDNEILVFDRQGNTIDKIDYEDFEILDFKELAVKKDGKWGAINSEGEVTIPLVYDTLSKSKTGYLIQENGKLGLLKNKHIGLLPPEYEFLTVNSNIVQTETGFGYINWKWIIPPIYESMTTIKTPSGTLLLVQKNGKYGFVNQDGTENFCD